MVVVRDHHTHFRMTVTDRTTITVRVTHSMMVEICVTVAITFTTQGSDHMMVSHDRRGDDHHSSYVLEISLVLAGSEWIGPDVRTGNGQCVDPDFWSRSGLDLCVDPDLFGTVR